MKSTLILTSIFFTSMTHAALTKGDFVRYKMTNSTNGVNQVMEQKIEITEVNPSAGTYSTRITVLANGVKISESSDTQDITSALESETTVDHCSEMPAEIATLETLKVAAGTFKVCHIHSEQEGAKLDQYLGKVLFGVVKSIIFNSFSNSSTTLELVEARKN